MQLKAGIGVLFDSRGAQENVCSILLGNWRYGCSWNRTFILNVEVLGVVMYL